MPESSLLQSKPTTIASWVLLVAQALDNAGVNSKGLFLKAGIHLDKSVSPQARFPSHQMAKVWQLAVEETNDPYFALQLAPIFQPSIYSAIGISISSSKNFHEALSRAVKYHQLASDAAQLQLEISPDYVDLIFIVPEENRPVADEAIEAFCITLLVLFRSMSDATLAPLSVTFEHVKNVNSEPYEQYFSAPVAFTQSQTRIRFSSDILERDLLFANPQLAAVVDEWVEQYLSSFKSDLISTDVKAYVLHHLALGDTDQSSAASSLGLSVRSLQRKLKLEDTSYSDILDECRQQMAKKYIRQKQIPIAEIAYLLGFSDQSNFTRSFRRWTDNTPQKYREKLLNS